MISLLHKLESRLERVFEPGSAIEPIDLVRQIEREIERNKRFFIQDRVYIAHKMVIHLHAPKPDRVEEYEALFNNPDFRKYVEDYIADKGYQLLDRLRIVIQCHQEALPEFGKRGCFIEFSWPQASSDPGEVTVVLDERDPRRISAVNAPKAEMDVDAWLEVLVGKAYQPSVAIRRRDFNIGRTENVLDASGGKILRVNHLVFARPEGDDLVNRTVSRRHARIRFREGSFWLHDGGSQNGTSVERGRSTLLVPRDRDGIQLQDGDVLLFGSTRVAFHLGSPMGRS